jgi:hypothetical protein
MTRWRQWWARLIYGHFGEYVLPTVSTWLYNKQRLSQPAPPEILPDEDWARRERHEALARSEDRLRGIEAKGPGLAAACAVVAAAVLLAVTSGWDNSTLAGRILLAAAAIYSAFSLLMPIYLVGPLQRGTIDSPELAEAARTANPEAHLAGVAAQAERFNTWRVQRLANLQNAARNDLFTGAALLLCWVVLAPVAGLVTNSDSPGTTGIVRPRPIVISPTVVVHGVASPPHTQAGAPPRHPRKHRKK